MLRRRIFIGSTFAAMTSLKARAARLRTMVSSADATALQGSLQDRIVFKGSDDYERLRQFAVFNAKKPKRYPEAIIMAQSVDDVVSGVKLARARGWQVGVRSGGHSWAAQHTRDKAILINLALLRELSVDPVARIATVSPSITGDQLNAVLQDQYGLMFPSAHGVGVGLGGFVMCGGHGWNARNWGPGCANLVALDVVTAGGELIHASETENSDFWWAARGAGPGYFAAAVRYYLQVHPMPKFMRHSSYIFSTEHLENVVRWVNDNAVGFPKGLEVVMLGRNPTGTPVLFLGGTAMADTEEEADAMLDLMEACPGAQAATTRKLKTTIKVPYRVEQPTESLPAGYRFPIDNIWTSAPSDQIVPLMRDVFTNFTEPKSYLFWQCWGPVHDTTNMAYSVQGNIYIAINAVYLDPAHDERNMAWAVSQTKKLGSIAVGAQMNDENMTLHPQRYLSAASAMRLEALRAKHDPERRFVSFLRV